MMRQQAKLLGLAAFSGTGKTTLLRGLIPLFKERGFRVGLIKGSHHDIEIDKPGKDSHILRMAGASPVMVSSPYRRAIITEHNDRREHSLFEELKLFDQSGVDIILVEGFKHESFPKIELHRPILGNPLLFPDDPSIIAIATDASLPIVPKIPLLDINSPRQVAEFIFRHVLNHGTS